MFFGRLKFSILLAIKVQSALKFLVGHSFKKNNLFLMYDGCNHNQDVCPRNRLEVISKSATKYINHLF